LGFDVHGGADKSRVKIDILAILAVFWDKILQKSMNQPDFWTAYRHFADYREALQDWILQDSVGPDPRQSVEQMYTQQDLALAFGQLLAAATGAEESMVRAALTEMHRLVKLVERDWLFWQSARQPATRQARQRDLLQKLQKIAEWQQALEASRE
jgi:hypothetical protein